MTFKRAADAAFVMLVALFLLLPAIWTIAENSTAQTDNRTLASVPPFPTTSDALAAWPRAAEAYLNDHFGFRRQLIDMDGVLRWTFFHRLPKGEVLYGRDGRLFLSEGDVPFRVALSDCGAWWSDDYLRAFAGDLANALSTFDRQTPGLDLIAIPTSPVLYSQDLPGWMARACRNRIPLIEQIRAKLPESLRAKVRYPLNLAAATPGQAPLIPKENFHWRGRGAYQFVEQFASRAWGLTPLRAPTFAPKVIAPDVAVYLPGVRIAMKVDDFAWDASREAICADQGCANQFPLTSLRLPGETMRLFRQGGGKRLLLLGDSFGNAGGHSLFAFFNDVIVLNMNQFQELTIEERRALWSRVTTEWRPDKLVLLFQDGNINRLASYAESLQDLPPYRP